jgi:ABC-type multidrug transport system fused ATPase/permease subunit
MTARPKEPRVATRTKPAAATAATDDEPRYRDIDMALVRRLLGALRPYRREYLIAISVGLVHVLCDLSGPKFIEWLMRHCSAPGAGIAGVARIIALWAGVAALSVAMQRWCIILMTRAGESVQFDLRQRMFAHLQELSMSYFDKTKLGRIISRMTSDINSMREVNVWGIWQMVANLMIMVVAAGKLLWTSPRLFLAVAWLGPILFVVNLVYLKRAGRMHQVVREHFTRVSSNLAENISGMRVVAAFDRQETNLAVFDELQEANTRNNVAVARMNGIYQPLLQVIGFVGRLIILAYGAHLIAAGQLSGGSVGPVVAAYLYWDWFMGPILNLGNFYNQMLQAMAGAERVFHLLDMQPDVADVPDAKVMPRIVGDVRFEGVTFGYDSARPVLESVSFDAAAGKTFALVGATGSGKTTITALVARFYQPQQGRVLVDGQDLRFVTGESLHRQMAVVSQQNYLFTGTVLDNIRYARPSASREDVVAAAQALGTHEALEALPDEYETQVGERGASLSLGQRQLVCFTRAFLADPRIFILDEATSAVDTATEQVVQRSLDKLLAGRTTFVVAHRLSTIMNADEILVIDKGRIIERGTHRELLVAGGKYSQLYAQFGSDGA